MKTTLCIASLLSLSNGAHLRATNSLVSSTTTTTAQGGHSVFPGSTRFVNKNPVCVEDTATTMDGISTVTLQPWQKRLGVQCCEAGVWTGDETKDYPSWKVSRPGCLKEKTYAEADAHCKSVDKQLCQISQLTNDNARAKGCGFDSIFVWTQTVCTVQPLLAATKADDSTSASAADAADAADAANAANSATDTDDADSQSTAAIPPGNDLLTKTVDAIADTTSTRIKSLETKMEKMTTALYIETEDRLDTAETTIQELKTSKSKAETKLQNLESANTELSASVNTYEKEEAERNKLLDTAIQSLQNSVACSGNKCGDADRGLCVAATTKGSGSSYNCECTAQYVGKHCEMCVSGFMGDKCKIDINECNTQTAICDAHASCVNNEGSYTCTCNTGFKGNGKSCVNIDECADDVSNTCSADAKCVDNEGSYMCTCNTGFKGNGKSCEKEQEQAPVQDSSPVMTTAETMAAVQGYPATVLSACRQKVGKPTWNAMSWTEKLSLVQDVAEEIAEEAAGAADESPAEDSDEADTKVATVAKLKPLVSLPDISFTNNNWVNWKEQGDPTDKPIKEGNTVLINGNNAQSRVRTTRLTVDMPAKEKMGGEGNLYFLADVTVTGVTCPENNPYKAPKMIISEGTDGDIMINTKVMSSFAFKYQGWSDGTEQTGGAVVSGWTHKTKKQTNFKITVEFVLHQCTGTMLIKNPRLLQVAPVYPIVFPFTVDPAAGVKINLRSGTVKPVNMKLFGANSQFAFSKVGGYESDGIKQLLETIRQPELRFPGGKASNFFDWETGMLLDDEVTRLDGGRAKTVDRGINWHFDEFCESLKKTDGSMTYVMNVIRDRTLENCQNELKKVLSCGVTIDQIELGNENMYKAQSYVKIGDDANAFEYTKWVRQVAAALREVEPHVKLTIPAAHHWNQWNDDLASEQMKKDGIFWDDMVMHPYVNVGSPIFNTGALATLLSAPSQFDHMLEVWDHSNLKDTKLAFTEWGLNYNQEYCPWGKKGNYAMTLLDAALFIKILKLGQTGQVVQASRHILVTQASHGLYQYAGTPGKGKYVKTANGAYFSKFIDVAQDSQSLIVQTESPELDDHVNAVTSTAFKQSDGNYKVLVVNSLDRPASAVLTVGTKGTVFTQCSTSSFSEELGAYPLYDLDEDPFSPGVVSKCSEVSVPAYSISVVTMLRKEN